MDEITNNEVTNEVVGTEDPILTLFDTRQRAQWIIEESDDPNMVKAAGDVVCKVNDAMVNEQTANERIMAMNHDQELRVQELQYNQQYQARALAIQEKSMKVTLAASLIGAACTLIGIGGKLYDRHMQGTQSMDYLNRHAELESGEGDNGPMIINDRKGLLPSIFNKNV
jgi:asparagine synthetase A